MSALIFYGISTDLLIWWLLSTGGSSGNRTPNLTRIQATLTGIFEFRWIRSTECGSHWTFPSGEIATFAVIGALSGCSSTPPIYDLCLSVTSPAPMGMTSGPTNPVPVALASYAADGSYARLYLASDHRTDNEPDHAPQRISIVSNLGQSSYALGQGASLLYRDDAVGVDCADWTGVLEWQPTSVEINAWCGSMHLIASLTGGYVDAVATQMVSQ